MYDRSGLDDLLVGLLKDLGDAPQLVREASQNLDKAGPHHGHLVVKNLGIVDLGHAQPLALQVVDRAGRIVQQPVHFLLIAVQLGSDGAQLFGGYTNLNGRSRDFRLRGAFESASGLTGLSASYRALFSTQEALSTELDPYFSVLRTYHPYHEFSISLRHELSERFGAEGGFSFRRLERKEDVGPFNHDFERYYALLRSCDWPWRGSEVSVVGNLYDTGSDRTWETELFFRQKIGENLKVYAGTSYSLYKENRYTLEEENDVRSVFIGGEYDILEDLSFRSRYVLEDDDYDITHYLEVGLRIRF